jgi:hypothetical protein
MSKLLYRIKRKLINTFCNEQWSLLICGPEGSLIAAVAPPRGRFWADPFPVEYAGKTYIFIEQQIGSGNGTLGYLELYPDFSCSDFNPILEKSYHLSFPNVFPLEKDGVVNWYLIPESNENRTIDLYRAEAFPNKWIYETTLMKNVRAVDTVVFYYNELWWLFTSIASDSLSANQNLHIFFSDTFPSNTWIPHPLNPVMTGFDNSRMAGSIYKDNNGNLIRPAQNCQKEYGHYMYLNKIVELTSSSYKEVIHKKIIPERFLHGACKHTINASQNYIIRDLKIRRLYPLSDINFWR